MKMRTLFSIALAGLMLGSCSKDVVNGDGGASWNENGTGFISLALNLPTTSGSRVGGGDYGTSFDDGEGREYEVKDAILVLFTGASEDVATFNSAYKLGLGNWENESSEQITTSARIVQEINKIENNGNEEANVYALVVLNSNGILSVDGTGLMVNGKSMAKGSDRLSNLNSYVSNIEDLVGNVWKGTGFLMSNAPLYNTAPGVINETNACSTLAVIGDGKIYPTEAEAIANPASSIYVERAQAKIQVKGDNKDFIINDKNGVEVTYNYELGSWDIDNYNNRSLLTRNFDGNWAGYQNETHDFYRFVDYEPVRDADNVTKKYRTYWGEDVNYAKITDESEHNLLAVETEGDKGIIPVLGNSIGGYTYCFENTTSEVPATGLELTRIIIEASITKKDILYNGDKGFFTVNGDRHTIYFNDASLDGSIHDRIKEFVLGVQSVQEAINNNVRDGKFTGNNIDLTINTPSVSGVMSNLNIDVRVDNADEVTYNEGGEAKIETAIALALQIAGIDNEEPNRFILDYYKDGKCYYQAFIRHFTDKECPWTSGKSQSANPNDYLGRYGVLRNNWYVLNVNSIKSIGDSTYPPLPEGPIDEEEFYLSVDINIMPWAKREQNVDL